MEKSEEKRFELMDNYNYGLTPEQVKEVLALGLTPWQFERVRGRYIGNRAQVIEIFKKLKAEGKPIPLPYEDHPNTMDNGTATFFWIAIILVSIIFKEMWLIWIFATIIYFWHITRHERENQKEFEAYQKEENK